MYIVSYHHVFIRITMHGIFFGCIGSKIRLPLEKIKEKKNESREILTTPLSLATASEPAATKSSYDT